MKSKRRSLCISLELFLHEYDDDYMWSVAGNYCGGQLYKRKLDDSSVRFSSGCLNLSHFSMILEQVMPD